MTTIINQRCWWAEQSLWEVMCCTHGLCHLMEGQPDFPVKCLWLRGPIFAHNFCFKLDSFPKYAWQIGCWVQQMNSQAAKQMGLWLCVHIGKLWEVIFTFPLMGKFSQSHSQSAESSLRTPRSESCSGTQCQCGLGALPFTSLSPGHNVGMLTLPFHLHWEVVRSYEMHGKAL